KTAKSTTGSRATAKSDQVHQKPVPQALRTRESKVDSDSLQADSSALSSAPHAAEPKEKSPKQEKTVKSAKVKKADEEAAQALTEDQQRWAELYRKYGSEKAVPYDMRSSFQASRPLNHKVFGWGWVLSSENDRLEVLFKEGRKLLIANFKR
ncbi:MAG: hypothetical protein N2578_07470, partial [Bdellovibrionaceae bacterium]|nr:hypothetical protein [Pseudobdellovibrionaceae bacterium]